ncbi:MAG: hypothetical protein Q7S87_19090 [Agitococcus sp.]|nr:hypothetical protein [Agitococcus sp.]
MTTRHDNPKKKINGKDTALLLATIFSLTPMSPAIGHAAQVTYKVLLAMESDELDCGRQGSIRDLTDSTKLIFDGVSSPLKEVLMISVGKTMRLAMTNLQSTDILFALGSHPELVNYGRLLQKQRDTQLVSPNIVAIAAQEHTQLIWQFTRVGEFEITAFQRDRYGRWQAGVTGKIVVQPTEPRGAVITP